MGSPPFFSMALPRRQPPTTPPRRGSTYPLTPSRVTPAAVVSACASTRPDVDCYGVGGSGSSSSSAASTLLSRVACSRRHSGVSSTGSGGAKEEVFRSVVASPGIKAEDEVMEPYDMLEDAAADECVLPWNDVIRFWPGNDNRDGYISFPDFERYSQSSEPSEQSSVYGGDREHEQDGGMRQSPKT